MTTQDALWKAIIEEFFDDFMLFFYSDFVDKIDTDRPFEVLDQELSKLFPETSEKNRRGDKLIKIPLKNGKEQFILIHIEVQGYNEKDYGRRMYVCQYRIDERYNLPVAALVIYTDKNKENRANSYERSCLKTRLLYEFDTFVIADHTIEEYEQMDNPFAIICQIGLMGLQRNLKDEELFQMKIQLFRKLLGKNYSKKRIQLLTTFIKEYVRFSKPIFYRKFDEETDKITKISEPMGLYETIIEYRSKEAREQALEQGLEKGMEKGLVLEGYLKELETNIEIINRLSKKGLTAKEIGEIFIINELFVREFQNKISAIDIINLLKKVKKCRLNFSPNHSLVDLKANLIYILTIHKFSEKAISKVLKVSLVFIKKVVKGMSKN